MPPAPRSAIVGDSGHSTRETAGCPESLAIGRSTQPSRQSCLSRRANNLRQDSRPPAHCPLDVLTLHCQPAGSLQAVRSMFAAGAVERPRRGCSAAPLLADESQNRRPGDRRASLTGPVKPRDCAECRLGRARHARRRQPAPSTRDGAGRSAHWVSDSAMMLLRLVLRTLVAHRWSLPFWMLIVSCRWWERRRATARNPHYGTTLARQARAVKFVRGVTK